MYKNLLYTFVTVNFVTYSNIDFTKIDRMQKIADPINYYKIKQGCVQNNVSIDLLFNTFWLI